MLRIHIMPDRCVGCRYCMLICSLTKENQIRPAVSRMNIHRDEHNGQQTIQVCRQCPDPVCIQVCPTTALSVQPDGLVRYDEDACILCRQCQITCPYTGIWAAPDNARMLKCDLCAGDPACVHACPVAALEVES